MKVTHLDTPGQLRTQSGHLIFIPAENPWGPKRLLIEEPVYSFGGDEDDNCIWVRGLVGETTAGGDKLFKRADWSFYPIAATPN